ncbi:hypothetical protein ACF0H5_018471 [Mactra antiquata]
MSVNVGSKSQYLMSVYTCIACRVVFPDGETQRAHYKTDWHRYNLKRKVAELPPVTSDNFKQRVLTAQQAEVVAEEKQSLICEVCRKTFSTQNAMQNHLQSKKHKETELKLQKTGGKSNKKNKNKTGGVQKAESKKEVAESKDVVNDDDDECMEDIETDSEVESVESFGDEDGLGIEECLFCSTISQSLEDNIKHMTEKHSFFLPDAEYISDLEGLITYLGQKVGIGNVCLWCNEKGKSFHTTQAVQKHMLDKGHCKILHDGDVVLEYADFYDYRSSYPDHNPDDDEDRKEEEMETDDVTPDSLAADGYELVLPSGATIGHRSLHRYYKQNINPRSGERTKSILPKMLAQYKALGWTGASGPVAERRCKDLAAVQRMKIRSWTKLGTKANKFQPHFRPQVVF